MKSTRIPHTLSDPCGTPFNAGEMCAKHPQNAHPNRSRGGETGRIRDGDTDAVGGDGDGDGDGDCDEEMQRLIAENASLQMMQMMQMMQTRRY